MNDIVKKRGRYTEPEARYFMTQILTGCQHMHLNSVIHRDLKLGNIFLDADMQYSCAYFETPDSSLDDAQLAKKRHLAAKLQVAPHQRVLDIGCCWHTGLVHDARREMSLCSQGKQRTGRLLATLMSLRSRWITDTVAL